MENATAYAVAERRLRQLYVFEGLIKNDGNHELTAQALGVHRHTIGRTLKALGMTASDVRDIAKVLKG
jgi:DNA-binding NtrC family response regulator